MGNWKSIPVNGIIPADIIVSEGDGPTLIANTDVTNPLFISDDAGMYAGQQNSIQLNPQSTIVVDGKSTIYALANVGKTVNTNVVPGGMSFFQSTILGLDFLVTNAGFFFYSGTPTAGNLIANIVSPATTHDPFGNPAVPVFFAGSVSSSFTQIDANGDLIVHDNSGNAVISISTTKLAMFFYGPGGIALGNLVYSISLQGTGFDSVGNAFLTGAASYQSGTPFTAQAQVGGIINYYTASNAGGPWTQVAQISTGSGDLILASNRNIVSQQPLTALAGLTWASHAVGDSLALSSGGSNPLLSIANTVGATSPLVRITLPSGVAPALGMSIIVSGDTNGRLVLDVDGNSNPRIRAGTGLAAPDTTHYRNSNALWASSPIAFDNAGAAEIDQSPTFANSWTQAARAGTVFRRCVTTDIMEWVGSVVVPAGFALNQNITTAVAPAYRPTNTQSITGWDITNSLPVRINFLSTGQLQFNGPVANTAAGHTIDIPCQQIRLSA